MTASHHSFLPSHGSALRERSLPHHACMHAVPTRQPGPCRNLDAVPSMQTPSFATGTQPVAVPKRAWDLYRVLHGHATP